MPTIALSPSRRLFIESTDGKEFGALNRAFQSGSGYGLLFLDTSTDTFTEDPSFAYWKDFARLYLLHSAV